MVSEAGLPIGRIQSVQVGQAREMAPSPRGPWRSAIDKRAVSGPVLVGLEGIEGDQQADRRYHGGPDKAILAYSADHYPHWQRELERDLAGGTFGENLTVAGLSEENVCLGDVWRVGPVELQVSQPRQPCWKLSARWGIPDLTRRVTISGRTGWYLRVLRTGYIESGMPIAITQRPYSQWPVRRANDAMFGRLEDRVALVELAAMAELAASWKADLM